MKNDVLWLDPQNDLWTEILCQAAAYDSYHLPAYHRVAEMMGEGTPKLFVYREMDSFVALPLLVRPIAEIGNLEGDNLQDATSVYGYPGPIVSLIPPSPAMLGRFRAALAGLLAEQRIITVFSRLNPLLEQMSLVEGLGQFIEHGLTVSIDLHIPAKQQFEVYRTNHRRDIKLLKEHGFTCEADTDLRHFDAFVAIYHGTMRRVNADGYYFFNASYFDALISELGGHLDLIVCRQGSEIVAAALFLSTHGIAQYHLGGTKDAWLREAPMKLLFEAAREMFQARGDAVLHLGGGVGGTQDSLFNFKAGFSGRRHLCQTWRWILSPESYSRLCARHLQHLGAVAPTRNGFFPIYRAS